MNDKFELINYEHTSLPVKVFLHRIGNVSPHWHDALEILFAIEGSFKITVNNSTFDIAKNDLIFNKSRRYSFALFKRRI
jgi:xylan 1,4-beta-xylosidase